MIVLTNARVITPAAELPRGWVRIDGSEITGVGDGEPPGSSAESVVDLAGKTVVPGFVDLHVHGGAGGSYGSADADQIASVMAFHRRHGTTTTLASLVTAPQAELERCCTVLAELAEDGVLAGIHLEGPFLSAVRCGAHDPRQLRHPDRAELDSVFRAGRGWVRQVTLAPELPGGVDFVRHVVDAGAVAAMGHTDATYEQAHTAIEAGARHATHLYNGMRPLHHREPGVVAAALDDERVVVELIADGVHLHDATVRLAFRQAGADRVALVTDAMAAAGMGDGVYPLGSMSVRVNDGIAMLEDGSSVAGSTLTMDAALRRAVTGGGVPLVDAVRAAATTPARVLGLDHHVGALAPGLRADLVVLDDRLTVSAVMSGGRWVDRRRP